MSDWIDTNGDGVADSRQIDTDGDGYKDEYEWPNGRGEWVGSSVGPLSSESTTTSPGGSSSSGGWDPVAAALTERLGETQCRMGLSALGVKYEVETW